MSIVPTFISACACDAKPPLMANTQIIVNNEDFFIKLLGLILVKGTRGQTVGDTFRSKLISDAELELAALAAEAVFLDWIAVIKPNRHDWQVQTHSDTNVLIVPSGKFSGVTPPRRSRRNLLRTKTPRTGINKSTIIENCEAYPFDDRDRVLHRQPGQGISAERISLVILRSYITESEPAEIARAAKIETIENRDDRV